MSEISSSIVINRLIEDVFAALTNVENTAKWFPGNVKEWWTSPPPHGVGSTRRARVKIGLVTTENDAVATVYDAPNRAVLKGTSKNAPFETELIFVSFEGGTRVDSNIAFFIRGPARVFGSLFIGWYRKRWEQGMLNLKRMMESGEL
jgi:carbon monoxide dehydrogenase subunit G